MPAGASPIVVTGGSPAGGVSPSAVSGDSPMTISGASPSGAASSDGPPGEYPTPLHAALGVKRRRTVKDEVMETTPVKKEEAEESDTGASPIGKGGSPEHIDCRGCGRSSVHGHCWFVAGESVQWAHKGSRGLWCKDCHTCWRTCFSGSHPLPLFGQFLKDVANFEDWEAHLVAFLSLSKDGCVGGLGGAKLVDHMLTEYHHSMRFPEAPADLACKVVYWAVTFAYSCKSVHGDFSWLIIDLLGL